MPGDIADMHVDAYMAGLDPNEMDGADWADFYGDDEPMEPDSPEEIASSLRIFTVVELIRHTQDGESLADTIHRLYPNVTKGQALGFEAVLEAMGAIPDYEVPA